jgi:hypothetical protein
VGPGEDLEVFQLRGERIRSIFYVGNLPEWEQIYISLIQDYNTLQNACRNILELLPSIFGRANSLLGPVPFLG